MHVCTRVYMYVCVYVWAIMCVCMYTCTYVCVCARGGQMDMLNLKKGVEVLQRANIGL